MCAAKNYKLAIVKWLCEMKADVECQSVVRMMCVFVLLYVAYVNISMQLCNLHCYAYGIRVNVQYYYDHMIRTHVLFCSLDYIAGWKDCSDVCE